MRVGLSYDEGTPKYRLYPGALLAAAESAEIDLRTVWLAGANRQTDEDALEIVDGLVLTGGSDVHPRLYGAPQLVHLTQTSPGRDDAEIRILERALARRIPILAICRGLQLLNVHFGGTLHAHLAQTAEHRLPDAQRHAVEIENGSGLHYITSAAGGDVTSSHHQAVNVPGDGLRAVAFHTDGTVEALEWEFPLRKPWLAAVQWHPERMSLTETLSGRILTAFLQAVTASRSLAV